MQEYIEIKVVDMEDVVAEAQAKIDAWIGKEATNIKQKTIYNLNSMNLQREKLANDKENVETIPDR